MFIDDRFKEYCKGCGYFSNEPWFIVFSAECFFKVESVDKKLKCPCRNCIVKTTCERGPKRDNCRKYNLYKSKRSKLIWNGGLSR